LVPAVILPVHDVERSKYQLDIKLSMIMGFSDIPDVASML
jgi:hypothetical protein